MYHLTLLALLLFCCGWYQIHFALQRRRIRRSSWDKLLKRLRPVDLDALEQLAATRRDSSNQHPAAVRITVKGHLKHCKELLTMRRNAKVMLELAVYAERWNPAHGSLFAEFVREDVVRLRRLAISLSVACLFSVSGERVRVTHNQTLTYYEGIRLRLEAVYAECHTGRLSSLKHHLAVAYARTCHSAHQPTSPKLA